MMLPSGLGRTARTWMERVTGSTRLLMLFTSPMYSLLSSATARALIFKPGFEFGKENRGYTEIEFDVTGIIEGGDEVTGFDQRADTYISQADDTVKGGPDYAVTDAGFDRGDSGISLFQLKTCAVDLIG